MPGASSMRGVTGFRALDAINGALAQLDPGARAGGGRGRQHARGLRRRATRRRRPVHLLRARRRHVGRHAARATATTALTNPASLAANIPVEVAESEFPILVERYGLVPDSRRRRAAPRRARGRARLAVPDAGHVADRPLRPRRAPAVRPARAGAPGALSSNVLVRPDGTEETLPSMFSTTIGAGDVYVHRTAGGGGWGDPRERDPARSPTTSPTGR